MKNISKMISKKDIWLFLIIVLIGVICLVMFSIFGNAEGVRVIVEEDGTEILNVSLYENKEYFLGSYEEGYNILVVKDGQASVSEASCPDLVCVHHEPISHNHETIVCLPRKLVVYIDSASESKLDSVSN